MPKVGQRVVVVAENSSVYGQTGKVTGFDAINVGRPYIVQFKGNVVRKFRRGDIYKPNQIEWC